MLNTIWNTTRASPKGEKLIKKVNKISLSIAEI